MSNSNLKIAVLGCGHWGPNHVRNLMGLRSAGVTEVVAVDRDEKRRRRVAEIYPA